MNTQHKYLLIHISVGFDPRHALNTTLPNSACKKKPSENGDSQEDGATLLMMVDFCTLNSFWWVEIHLPTYRVAKDLSVDIFPPVGCVISNTNTICPHVMNFMTGWGDKWPTGWYEGATESVLLSCPARWGLDDLWRRYGRQWLWWWNWNFELYKLVNKLRNNKNMYKLCYGDNGGMTTVTFDIQLENIGTHQLKTTKQLVRKVKHLNSSRWAQRMWSYWIEIQPPCNNKVNVATSICCDDPPDTT